MAKDFDKEKKKRASSRPSAGGKGSFSKFKWDSVDDDVQEDMIIEPTAKRKSAKSARRRDKDVGTMYVVHNDDLLTPVKKKAIKQTHAEDYAQFRAEIEEGEVDPYAIPSYGGMKVSHEIEELAEELAARREKKEKSRGSERKRESAPKTESVAKEDARAEKKTAKAANSRAAKSSVKAAEESGAAQNKETKVSTKKAVKEPALVDAPAKPRKRSFLSKIQEAISTGRIAPSEEPASEQSEAQVDASVEKLPAKKMRWLTQNALKVLDASGVESDSLRQTDDRSQLEVLSGLLEALIKANLSSDAEKGATVKAKASKKAADSSPKPTKKAEEIFDVVDNPDSDVKEAPKKAKKQETTSRSKPRKEEPKSKEPVPEVFDEDYFDDPISYWENLSDDDVFPQGKTQDRERNQSFTSVDRIDDDFEEWDEVGSKKKSARLRKDSQEEPLLETSVSGVKRAKKSSTSVKSEPEPESAKPEPKRRAKKAALPEEPREAPVPASEEKSKSGRGVKKNADSETEASVSAETKPKRGSKKADAAAESDAKNDEKVESKRLEKFGDLVLTKTTLRALQQMGYVEPTPIQAGTIPCIQSGIDLMGQAKTGTGKTAAFMIPIIEAVDKRDPEPGPLALVVAPTRELAVQIRDEAQKIAKYRDLNIVACYGGKPIASQVEKIRKGVDILVGTPGRIIDLTKRGVLSLAYAHWVVLDEADRMLDIGFRPDVEKILRKTPSDRQTLLFSATLAPPVVRLAQKYMKDPEQFDFSLKDVAADTIDQYYLTVDQDRKFDALVRLLEIQQPRQTIVFCRTKRHVDMVGRRLSSRFKNVEAIHGDLPQTKRDNIMRDFRAEKTKILVATDIVGRGIDVSTVSHIVNYDVPQYCDDYVHRVGRAGRMGREGVAFTLVTAEEGAELTRIEIRINRLLERMELPGFEAYSKPSEQPAEPPERKPVFGQSTRRIRRAL